VVYGSMYGFMYGSMSCCWVKQRRPQQLLETLERSLRWSSRPSDLIPDRGYSGCVSLLLLLLLLLLLPASCCCCRHPAACPARLYFRPVRPSLTCRRQRAWRSV